MLISIIRRRPFLSMALVLIVAWGCYLGFGGALGKMVATSCGNVIGQLGGGKVPDQARYVTQRGGELLWLISLAWIIGLVTTALLKSLSTWSRRASTFAGGIVLFAALNLWSVAASRTALFWLILRGTTVENQAQFRAKENLLGEIGIHPVIALVGNSQARTEITEEQFNQSASGRAWMMELHFPGCRAADVFLLSERYDARQVNEFVYYVSPGSFYVTQSDSAIARDLLRLRDLPTTLSIDAWSHFPPETRRYAALGMALPLFQYRSSLQHAVFGSSEIVPPAAIPQPAAPTAATIPHAPVRGLAASSPEADYQKAAFRRFLEHATAKGQHVIVIGGQWNPAAEALFPPDIRPDYEQFLKECARTYPAMTLVWQNELLVQPPEAYVDDVHASEKTAECFTEAFAKWYFGSERQRGNTATP